MNQLLRDYINEDRNERPFTYNVKEDVDLFIDNLDNEFPRLTGKEWIAVYKALIELTKEEYEFCEGRDMELLPSSLAGYELIWSNHMKELIEEL